MKINENNIKYQSYKTSDFYLACFLLSKNIDLLNIEPLIDNPKKMNFVFVVEKDNIINDLINSFYNGKGLVSVKKYMHSIRDLKGMLYKN